MRSQFRNASEFIAKCPPRLPTQEYRHNPQLRKTYRMDTPFEDHLSGQMSQRSPLGETPVMYDSHKPKRTSFGRVSNGRPLKQISPLDRGFVVLSSCKHYFNHLNQTSIFPLSCRMMTTSRGTTRFQEVQPRRDQSQVFESVSFGSRGQRKHPK